MPAEGSPVYNYKYLRKGSHEGVEKVDFSGVRGEMEDIVRAEAVGGRRLGCVGGQVHWRVIVVEMAVSLAGCRAKAFLSLVLSELDIIKDEIMLK